MGGLRHRRAVLAAVIVLAVITAASPMWAQSSLPAANSSTGSSPTVKIGAVSQQTYAGALAQAESGLQRQIKFGSPVYALETVRTSENGSTELQFLDEARLHIGPNASVKLDQYTYDPTSGYGSGLIDMFNGAYDFVSGKMHSDDKVKLVTPTVTIGLRGTALSIFIAGDGRTDITVTQGLVSLAPCRFGVVATVQAGQKASVDNSCLVSFPDEDQPDQTQQPFRRQDWIIKHPNHQKPPKQKSTKTY